LCLSVTQIPLLLFPSSFLLPTDISPLFEQLFDTGETDAWHNVPLTPVEPTDSLLAMLHESYLERIVLVVEEFITPISDDEMFKLTEEVEVARGVVEDCQDCCIEGHTPAVEEPCHRCLRCHMDTAPPKDNHGNYMWESKTAAKMMDKIDVDKGGEMDLREFLLWVTPETRLLTDATLAGMELDKSEKKFIENHKQHMMKETGKDFVSDEDLFHWLDKDNSNTVDMYEMGAKHLMPKKDFMKEKSAREKLVKEAKAVKSDKKHIVEAAEREIQLANDAYEDMCKRKRKLVAEMAMEAKKQALIAKVDGEMDLDGSEEEAAAAIMIQSSFRNKLMKREFDTGADRKVREEKRGEGKRKGEGRKPPPWSNWESGCNPRHRTRLLRAVTLRYSDLK